MIGLDHLKTFNDDFGHDGSDVVLKESYCRERRLRIRSIGPRICLRR
jgi:GGDEF domain-containing protein